MSRSSLPLKRCMTEFQEGLSSGSGSGSGFGSGSGSAFGSGQHRQQRRKQTVTPIALTTTTPTPTPLSDENEDYVDDFDYEIRVPFRRLRKKRDNKPAKHLKSQNPIELNANKTAADKTLPITVSITDVHVFDCPICFENLNGDVYQCENGHIVCDSCCQKINNKCPSCSFPTGHIRCLAIEKILEASRISCKNAIYGCKDIMKYHDGHVHESLCIYSPCSCPIFECDFINSVWNFFKHFDSNHLATSFRLSCPVSVSLEKNQRFVFLKEELSRSIFVVNQFTVCERRAISIVRIAPGLFIGKYDYEVKLKDGDSSLTLQSMVENVPNLGNYRCTKRFLVVDDFIGNVESVSLDICIKSL